MSGTPPFNNSYLLRTVSETDSKSCFVCYKPSSKVLISDNKVDFFYICPSHLKDSTFSIPVESDEYKGLIGEKASMILKISDLEREIKNLGYNWDIVSKIPGFGKKENADDKDKDKETEKKKTLSKDGPALQRELTATRAEMEELSQKIENFLFKQYNLDNNIYRNRVRSHIQAKVNQKRQQELQKPGFFPSAPKGDI